MTAINKLVEAALERRESLFARLAAEDTDCYRVFHGIAEGQPGLTVDRYGAVLLLQTWREPLETDEVQSIGEQVSRQLDVELTAVWNHRGGEKKQPYSESHSAPDLSAQEAREVGLQFAVDPRHGGRDPLFFLDFRAARRRLRSDATDCSVLNLFSYTGTAGVAALAGGASEVVNVDFAQSALDVARANSARNGFSATQASELCADALLVTRQFAGLPIKGRGVHRARRGGRLDHRAHRGKPPAGVTPRQFDRVVLDPPRWATSRFGAVDLVRDYPGVFKPALLATRPGGKMLVANNAAALGLDDWLGILQRCATKAERPIKNIEVIPPEEDFPSFDGKHPLKVAWLDV